MDYRLGARLALNTDVHPPLNVHEAAVEADRCYFCHDAPCVTACPTGIDIPMFIRQIQAGNPLGSARTILDENIFGGMCARVCPTETLCEQACVRESAEAKPVQIGLLQRFASDHQMALDDHPYERGPDTGKSIAVVGAGPAGLSCAHRLAMHGHQVTVFEARAKSGGLNEYGIAAYKTIDDFARREVDFILGVGGIEIKNGVSLGSDVKLSALLQQHDAVFIAVGLGDVNELALEGVDAAGVEDAVGFIEQLRQSDDYASLNAGQQVVVIGGGMTAIDAAVQSKLLGADEVTIAYRRGAEQMNASGYEQQLAQTSGVTIRDHLQPERLITDNGKLTAIELQSTRDDGVTLRLAADKVLVAIGQQLIADELNNNNVSLANNRVVVDEHGKTSCAKLWAGGDCVSRGEDLTVSAVQGGKLAAMSIHASLTAG